MRVRDYFEANRTAYIVMDYEEGEPLDKLLERHGTLTEAQLRRVLLPIVEGLKAVHAAGFLHRDIKPSNVFVRRSSESPVLLDFGAARQALGRKSKSLTAVASAGYSPPEQYESEGVQGAWTDIYALSAVCYRAIAGHAPIEAPRRQSRMARGRPDPLLSLAESEASDYSKSFLEAVDQGLRVIETERPQSLNEWAAALSGGSLLEPASDEPRTGPATPVEHDSGRHPVQRRGRSRAATWIGATGTLAVSAVAVFWWVHLEQESLSAVNPGAQTTETGPVTPEPQATSAAPPASPLEGGKAILVVETEPEGVDVLIAGTLAGQTPLQVMTVRSGTYALTLRHDDYETIRLPDQSFTDGEVLRVDRRLQRATGGRRHDRHPRRAAGRNDRVDAGCR